MTEFANPTCPKCAQEFTAGKYGEVPVIACPECSGILVERSRLIPLLEAGAIEVRDMVDLDTPLPSVERREGALCCPRCQAPMESFGYMGTDLVHLDRCEPCNHIWFDGGELAAACVLYARTELRRTDREARSRERTITLDAMVSRLLLQRRLDRRIFVGTIPFYDIWSRD